MNDLMPILSQLLANGIIAGSIYSLIAIGFALIYKTVKYFHFAHGAVYTFGAYVFYYFIIGAGYNIWISLLAVIILCSMLGIAIERVGYRPLQKAKSPNLVYLLVSFGVFIFIQSFIHLLFTAQVKTLNVLPAKEVYHIYGVVITNIQIVIIVVNFIILIISWLIIQKLKTGKAIRAVADNSIGARVIGIPSDKAIIAVYAIGSALAGVAGILVSLETNIEPTMGMNAILKGITASIIGGIGSIPGAMLGGLTLGLAENLGIWKIQAGWKDCIAFAILIIFLVIRPGGIMGVKTKNE